MQAFMAMFAVFKWEFCVWMDFVKIEFLIRHFEYLICINHHSKDFEKISTFDHQNNPLRYIYCHYSNFAKEQTEAKR